MEIQHGYIIGAVCGLLSMAIGGIYYRRGGKGLVVLGAASVVGASAPLLADRLSEQSQIAMSIVSMILSLSGVAIVVLDTRARRRSA